MKITDVSMVDTFSSIIIIDCIHESFKEPKPPYRYEIFILNRNNELLAHYESNDCINVSPIDYGKNRNLFTFENTEIDEPRELKLHRVEKDNTITYLNTYEDIEEGEEDSYYAVKRNGLYGFIDINGNEVITPQYTHYRSFRDGLAMVRKDKKWGAIDKNNNVIIPLEYWREGGSWHEYILMKREDSGVDVYNKQGKIVFQGDRYMDVFALDNGYLLVENPKTREFEFVKPED